MDDSVSIETKFQWNSYLLNSSLDSVFSDQLTIFLQRFESEWIAHFRNATYQLCQLESGNRLRPIISFLGYLTSETEVLLTADDFNRIVKVGVCIELIHKSSLIIDDMIDGDSLRSGKTTFHIANGQEKAIAVSFHLIGKSFKLLIEAMEEAHISQNTSLKCLKTSINIVNDMSTGLLKELSMVNADYSDINLAKEIILNETASIIKNSLLIGYLLRGGSNQSVINSLMLIGESCGYIFQVMNDIEPYRNGVHYKNHKGKNESEFFYNRKNIVTTFILQLMNSKEKREFYHIGNSGEGHKKLLELFNTHHVYDHFMSDIKAIKINIEHSVDTISKEGINMRWCLNCKSFITALTEVALTRIS